MSAAAKRRIITVGVWVLVALLAVTLFPESARFVAHPPQWVRVANVIGSVVALVGYAVRLNDVWHVFNNRPGPATLAVALGIWPLSAAVGSVLAYRQHIPTTTSSLIITGACVATLAGLWFSRDDK